MTMTTKRITLDIDWQQVDYLMERAGVALYELPNGPALYKARRHGLKTIGVIEELAHQLGTSPLRLLREVVVEQDQSTIEPTGERV